MDSEGIHRSEAGQAIIVFDSIIEGIWYAAGFSSLAGLIAMLANIKDPAGIAQGIAVLLLSLLYAVFVILFFILPFKGHLEAATTEKK